MSLRGYAPEVDGEGVYGLAMGLIVTALAVAAVITLAVIVRHAGLV